MQGRDSANGFCAYEFSIVPCRTLMQHKPMSSPRLLASPQSPMQLAEKIYVLFSFHKANYAVGTHYSYLG